MAKKKKRTKSKKQSGGETKARRAKKSKESEEAQEVKAEKSKASASDDSAGDAEDAEDAEETEEKAEVKEETKPKKKAKKAKEEARKTAMMLTEATTHFSSGRYRDARAKLVTLLESSPTPEEREQAQELLGNMEMDVRTLMVGAVAMVTLLLIPTLGYTNFAKALWTIPVLFLLLIVDPRLFRSPGTTASDES